MVLAGCGTSGSNSSGSAGQGRAPDGLDMGTAFAIKAGQEGLLAPDKVRPVELPSTPRPPPRLSSALSSLAGLADTG